MLSVLLNKDIEDYNHYIVRHFNNGVSPYVTGLEVEADKIYSISPGKVISTGYTPSSRYCITVLVNNNQMVRYTNLDSINVSAGDNVSYRTYLGIAHGFVRLEYCTSAKGNSMWPVRIKSLTMYKQDPIGLLTRDIKLVVVVNDVEESTGFEELIPLDKHVLAEFTGSRGDDNE